MMVRFSALVLVLSSLLCLCSFVHANKYVDEQVERLYCGKQNCYELLGQTRGVTEQQLRKSYRRIALALHPDRNPDPFAAQQMAKVNKALEILTNKATRGAYDYYLDHPNDLLNLFYGIQAVYPARTNPLLALALILSFISICHMVHTYNMYHQQVKEVQQLPAWQQALNERAKQIMGEGEKTMGSKKKQQIREECRQEMLNEYIATSGIKPYLKWNETWGVKLLWTPMYAARYIIWYTQWVVNYDVLGNEYSEEDKAFLTRKFYGLSQQKWEGYTEKDQQELLQKKVWDPICKEKIEQEIETKELERQSSAVQKRNKRAAKKPQVPANFND